MKLASLIAFALVSPSAAAPAQNAPYPGDLGSIFPERCDLFVEAPGLATLLDAGLEAPLLARIERSELLRSALAENDATLEGLIAFGGMWLERPLLETVADLSRGGLALGVDFSPTEPAVLFALDAARDEVLDFALERVFDTLEERFDVPGAFDEPHRIVHGSQVWKLGEEGLVGRRGTRLFVSNDRSLFLDALSLAKSGGGGLGGSTDFEEARSACPEEALLWARLAMDQLEERSVRAAKGLEGLRTLPMQPAVQFLLGDAFARLGTARTLTASLSVRGADLELSLQADGADAPTPLAPANAPAEATSGTRLASAFVYRDLSAIVGERAQLFAARDLPGFARALTELSPLFGGIDIERDLLPGIAPWIELVVDPISFATGQEPEIVLPAGALIARIDDPAVGDTLITAFQTVVSLQMVEAGNRERPTHRLSLALEGDVPLYRALLPDAQTSEGIDVIYNLQPTCAVVGDRFIIGTHERLVRELVRTPATGKPSRNAGARESVAIDAAGVAASLSMNREALIAHKVVSEGVSFEEAGAEIDGLIGLSRWLGHLQLEIEHVKSTEDEGTVHARLSSRPQGERHAR